MIRLLIKLFIKNSQNTEDKNVRIQYCVLTSAAGIFFNLILFASKYFAGVISNSIAITADAFNNLSDACSSAVSLIGFKLSGKKPDKGHPFGHGRIEYVTGFTVSLFILVMGFEIAKSSVQKIISPEIGKNSFISIAILVFSIAVKSYMAVYGRSIGKKIDSAAVLATAADSLSDCLATAAVLASMLIYGFTGLNIDGYCGLLVSLFILKAGFSAAKDTLSPLLGQAPKPELVEEISSIVLEHTEIIGIHDLIVHDYGPGRLMISLHAEVHGDNNIIDIHNTVDSIERELDEKLGCSSVIHIDPVETDNAEELRRKDEICKMIKELDERFTVHDFRTVKCDGITKVIFDVVIPYEYKLSDDEVKKLITDAVLQSDSTLAAVITVDKAAM